jgi:arylsulfatase
LKTNLKQLESTILALLTALVFISGSAQAQSDKPNIILLVSDDTGYGDLGPYGGGEGRGMPTPNIDRLAAEGMTLFSFYAQPSCTPGRAAMQTGRIPNRSGMTTVAFQGQGGGLPAAEWTLASVLKTAGYQTFFTGKWHMGEADYALPNAQGYDEMKYVGLYHLNAYTYADPTWFPDMPDDLRAMFKKVTQGALSGKAGETAKEDFKINGQYVDKPDSSTADYPTGVVGIPYFDGYVEKASLDYLDRAAKSDKPFFMSINFMKVHQPNMPHPDYEHKSLSKSKYADSVVELDSRIGRIMDKLRSLGLDKNTLVIYTTDNGAWQDVYPDAGYTPFRGTKGTVREGGNRVPAIAWWPGKIKVGSKNHDINYKALFNLRGDNGQATGGLAVDSNLGWKGAEKYVATVPQVFDLWQDPQERYDIFMNNYTERTWTLVTISQAIEKKMKTYIEYPPRKPQSETYTGPITLSQYMRFQHIRKQLQKQGFKIPLPTGN